MDIPYIPIISKKKKSHQFLVIQSPFFGIQGIGIQSFRILSLNGSAMDATLDLKSGDLMLSREPICSRFLAKKYVEFGDDQDGEREGTFLKGLLSISWQEGYDGTCCQLWFVVWMLPLELLCSGGSGLVVRMDIAGSVWVTISFAIR